jgi:hypothetical protein
LPTIKYQEHIYFDVENFCRYTKIIDYIIDEYFGQIPVLYIEALALSTTGLKVFLDKEFPFSVPGLIHVRNQVVQYKSLSFNEKLLVETKTADTEIRRVSRGIEFDLKICAYDKRNVLVWSAFCTFLAIYQNQNRKRKNLSRSEKCSEISFNHVASKKIFLSSDIGRKYAAISGDYNPIHLHPFLAKLFGFKSHVAHGLYTAALCINECQKLATDLNIKDNTFKFPYKVEVFFKRPAFLPNEVTISISRFLEESGTPKFLSLFFSMAHNDNVLLEGSIHHIETEDNL